MFHKTDEQSFSYGGEGYQIIYYVLVTLLDKTKYDLIKFKRLSWDTLIQKVVLPETVVRLIQEDLRISREEAIATFRESGFFGNLMHPGDDQSRFHALQSKVAGMFGRAQQQSIEIKLEENVGMNDLEISLHGVNTVIEDGHVVYILDDD